jgi:hypothetical protein
MRFPVKRAGTVMGALGLGLGVSVLAAGAAWASSNLPGGGTVTLTQTGTTTPLATNTQLASTVPFDVDLPSGAACSVTGANGGEYQSFLVPAGATLSQLTITNDSTAEGAGVVDQGVALANAQGWTSFEPAQNTPAGGIDTANTSDFEMGYEITPAGLVVSGAQIPLPNPALIPTGQSSANYEAGEVCFNKNGSAETDFWAVPVVLTVSNTDPGGFTWEIPAGSGPTVAESPLAVGLPLGGGAVLVGAVFINRRRRRTGTGPVVA